MAIQVQRGPRALTPTVHDANLGVIVDASNQLSDTGWLAPGQAYIAGGTTLGLNGTAKPALSIPEGGSAVWSIRPNTSWNNHLIVLRAVYRGTSSVITPFSITWIANGLAAGTATSVTVGTSTTGIPGVTTANQGAAFEVTLNTLPITARMETLGISIARAASDPQGSVALALLGIQYRVYAN
jgi:hypothetical protein